MCVCVCAYVSSRLSLFLKSIIVIKNLFFFLVEHPGQAQRQHHSVINLSFPFVFRHLTKMNFNAAKTDRKQKEFLNKLEDCADTVSKRSTCGFL
jgi:hypothetical protein